MQMSFFDFEEFNELFGKGKTRSLKLSLQIWKRQKSNFK